MDKPEAVESTSHIRFNEVFKTFTLIAGNSLYCFCIGPELTLEHLYWGEKLETEYDMRYLSQSLRFYHFTTVEAAPLAGKICADAETTEEGHRNWWDNKKTLGRKLPDKDIAAVQRLRLQNYSWRIHSMASHDGRTDVHGVDVSHGIGDTGSPEMNLSSSVDTAGKHYEAGPSPRVPSKRFSDRYIRKKHRQIFEREPGKIGKGMLCCEYADQGTGDYRIPSFAVVDNLDGSPISPLRYKRHAIYRGKLPMPDGMPSIRCHNESEASTLVVTLADEITGLEIDLVYGKRASPCGNALLVALYNL
jgi:hypothetical protein